MSRRPRTVSDRVRVSFSLSEFDFLKLRSLATLRNLPVALVSQQMVEQGLRNTNEHDLLEGIREAQTTRSATKIEHEPQIKSGARVADTRSATTVGIASH
jgi:hypothetical protein